jgi:hypothetical protein
MAALTAAYTTSPIHLPSPDHMEFHRFNGRRLFSACAPAAGVSSETWWICKSAKPGRTEQNYSFTPPTFRPASACSTSAFRLGNLFRMVSTRRRGRYGRKRDAVDCPFHGYHPRADSAPVQRLFPLIERRPRRSVLDTVRLHHAGVCRLQTPPGLARQRNPLCAPSSRVCQQETRPDHV